MECNRLRDRSSGTLEDWDGGQLTGNGRIIRHYKAPEGSSEGFVSGSNHDMTMLNW